MRNFFILIVGFCFLASGCSKDQFAEDLLLIQDFLSDNNLTAQSTASGLHYIIHNQGTGGSPSITSEVTVLYTGSFLDGTVFDQTNGTPVTFDLAFLIPGWIEGLQLLEKNGQATLLIPSELGYGSNPPPGFPKNAVLLFDITLVNWN
ncbi:MAG: FKBP-type peptidyl-prolyl cis-trans isomerase [Bacteroidota bacterium]